MFRITESVTVLHLFLKVIFKRKKKINGIVFNLISDKHTD